MCHIAVELLVKHKQYDSCVQCHQLLYNNKYNNFICFKHIHVLAHNKLIGIEKCIWYIIFTFLLYNRLYSYIYVLPFVNNPSVVQ